MRRHNHDFQKQLLPLCHLRLDLLSQLNTLIKKSLDIVQNDLIFRQPLNKRHRKKKNLLLLFVWSRFPSPRTLVLSWADTVVLMTFASARSFSSSPDIQAASPPRSLSNPASRHMLPHQLSLLRLYSASQWALVTQFPLHAALPLLAPLSTLWAQPSNLACRCRSFC